MRDDLDRLTLTHLAILEGWSRGLTDKEIGRELGMAEGTVRAHAGKIYDRLRARSRAHAVAMWAEAVHRKREGVR